ncbi:MAG: hypothetical protein WD000_00090 [Thermodesulfobacteriota bacterium]
MSPAAINALKEALYSLYWYKEDLRSFLNHSLKDRALVASLDWNKYKWQIVYDLVDILCDDQEKYLPALTKLCYDTVEIRNFTHLQNLEDGAQKVKLAQEAVNRLRELVEPHQEVLDEQKNAEKRKKDYEEKLKSNQAVREKLFNLKKQYSNMATSMKPQEKGYALEKLMYDIFELFDLDPKASFKNTGEQIDGGIKLEGTEYLFEAKWQQSPSTAQDLDVFSSKVKRKLDNTLGVFLSINGFSEDGVKAHSVGRPNIILMDGSDLMAVLEERIDFVTLLIRKKRHASQTGQIYLRSHLLGL